MVYMTKLIAMLRLLVWLCIAGGVSAQGHTWEVQIEQGTLRGYRNADGDIFTFLDVPYATAPTGSDKFKASLPAPIWTETFDAVFRGVACHQPDKYSFNMQDDCLVANIFVPDTNATDLPVMVYVHGGAFKTGAGHVRKYTSLVKTQRVVVVTFNYRLAVQGFLCLGTEDVPGNAGMKDQVSLLRWVKRNIASFRGNPNDVTIYGCSAGGSSVDLLTLSPMTTGLFSKVITESGSSISYAAGVQMDPIENAKIYARILNFTDVDNLEALEEFYKTTPYDLIYFQISALLDNSGILFAPCIERDTGTGEERFLSDSPWSIITKGEYPVFPLLYGYTEMEGILQLDTFHTIDDMSDNFSYYLPHDLRFESEQQKEEVAQSVRKFYFGDGEISQDSVLEFVDYYTDIMFAYPMLRGLKLRRDANNDTVYLYEYSFTDENTDFIHNTAVKGVDHCTQSYAVMDQDTTNFTTEYIQMKATIREMWLNFMISGNPVPENSSLPAWPPVNDGWSPHMAIHSNSSANESLILGERAQFWEDIYEQYYHGPAPPDRGGATSNYVDHDCNDDCLHGI